MRISVVAETKFHAENAEDTTGGVWEAQPDASDSALLSEYAGRGCYDSWDKPNPDTADNPRYIRHIIEVNHHSVLEHGSITFRIDEVSRSLTHELIRHRHMSPSQQSQRYVTANSTLKPVVPPLFKALWQDDPMLPISETQGIIEGVWEHTLKAYTNLIEIWEQRLIREYGGIKVNTIIRKRAREAARCVLPNMTPTSITITGNHRTWRHFLELRGSLHADAEIRELALALYYWLTDLAPELYADFDLHEDKYQGMHIVRVTDAPH